MHRLIEDLRFFIGAFFLIIGSLLILQGMFNGTTVEEYNLNLWTGLAFVMFAGGALYLSIKANRVL